VEEGKETYVWTRARTKEGGSGSGRDGTTVSTLLLVKSFQFGLYRFTGDRAQTSFLFLKKREKKGGK
jgi:hypothetical protein